MTAPRHTTRGPDGKFVRADGKPTLHRQVGEPDAYTVEWLQRTAPKPDPHGPRISLGILVCIVLAIALSLAIIAWLLGVRL